MCFIHTIRGLLAAVADWNRYRRVKIHAIALTPELLYPGKSLITSSMLRAAAFMQELARAGGGNYKILQRPEARARGFAAGYEEIHSQPRSLPATRGCGEARRGKRSRAAGRGEGLRHGTETVEAIPPLLDLPGQA